MRVKIASEPEEFDQIHALNHLTFVEEIPRYTATGGRRLVDRFHDENTYIIALRDDRVAGMLAVRERRPFSLDERLPGLDSYLPKGRSICELRLLAVDKGDRGGLMLFRLIESAWRYIDECGFDLAIISGTTRQLKLYCHLGFEPFGPLVGSPEARFQPMMLTRERFAPRAARLFERGLNSRAG